MSQVCTEQLQNLYCKEIYGLLRLLQTVLVVGLEMCKILFLDLGRVEVENILFPAFMIPVFYELRFSNPKRPRPRPPTEYLSKKWWTFKM